MLKPHRLIELDWPEFGGGTPPAPPGVDEFTARLESARAAMERDVLGIDLPKENLPFSTVQALVPPFFFNPQTMLALQN